MATDDLMVADEYLIDSLLYTNGVPTYGVSEPEAVVLAGAQKLSSRFAEVLPHYEMLDSYYRGCPPSPSMPERLTQKYQELMTMARSNWCGLIVDVVDERLRIEAIKSKEHPVQDPTAWDWWEANNMALHASEVHVEALKSGVAYVSVWPADKPDGAPRIIGESPLSTYVSVDDNTQAPTEAIRIWFNRDDRHLYADYTTSEFQFKLVSLNEVKQDYKWWRTKVLSQVDVAGVAWRFRQDVMPIRTIGIGVLPYVVFTPRPDLLGEYRSELEGLLDVQNRINRTTFDRLVTQEMTAFPQRWVTGIDIPEDPVTREPREPFNAAVDRVWTLSAPDGKFGQFPQSTPEGYLAANTADIQAMATQSRTPPHYLIAGMGQFPSGESVRATEYGLTRKINSRQIAFGDTWGDVLRMVALTAGNTTLANDSKMKVNWADVEAHSEAEVADAILKLAGIPGVPIEPLLARAGLDPDTFAYYRDKTNATTQSPFVTSPQNQIRPEDPHVAVPSKPEPLSTPGLNFAANE
jgi:hypothetical protein